MNATEGHSPAREGVREPWRVSIRDDRGTSLGAGMILGTRYVLTCAHVLMKAHDYRPGDGGTAPNLRVRVGLVVRPDLPVVAARVAAGAFVPPLDDERGDVALLELERAAPEGFAAPLRRLPLSWDRPVHVFGAPATVPSGVWVKALLSGECGPGGEWVQMNAARQGPQVRQGFSGAAVVDDATGHVVGLVVGDSNDDTTGVSWMITVETVLKHLPRVAEWTSGVAAVDDSFVGRFSRRAVDSDTARQVADFFTRRSPGQVMIINTGDADSSISAALRRAVVLSARDFRLPGADPAGRPGRDGTTPPVGSIDLAIDATGKTAEEVSRRIVDRMGITVETDSGPIVRLAGDAPAMTLVIVGIDEAADPAALLAEVIKPLIDQAARRNIRVVLGFRWHASPGLSLDGSTGSAGAVPPDHPERVRVRVDRLAELIVELHTAELLAVRSHEHVAARVTPVPRPSGRAVDLRQQLTEIRLVLADGRTAEALARIEQCERDADRALGRATELRQQLDGVMARRNELRGHLEAYKAKATEHGYAEDSGLATLYRSARELLWRGPCDLAVCAEAVDRYAETVRAVLAAGGRAGS